MIDSKLGIIAIGLALTVYSLTAISAAAQGSERPNQFSWQLPSWLSPPDVPDDNTMSNVKVELGRRLFFDIRLSGPG